MQPIVSQLQALVTGALPDNHNLLHTCKLEAFGKTIWGHRAIAEYFIANPLQSVFDTPHILTSQSMVAILGVDENSNTFGLFCETIRGNIQRIWVVGPVERALLNTEEYVSVAFDPMLSQLPDYVALDESVHPELGAQGASSLRALLHSQYQSFAKSRRKVFVLRAFSDAQEGAALLAVHHLQTGEIRHSGCQYVVTTFKYENEQIVHSMCAEDLLSEQQWSPRIDLPTPSLELTSPE